MLRERRREEKEREEKLFSVSESEEVGDHGGGFGSRDGMGLGDICEWVKRLPIHGEHSP